MPYDVIIVGAGAAGIAAARRLHDAGRQVLVLEARSRIGGRAWTMSAGGFPLDLGCGWLHSADRNPWSEIARDLGLAIDKTPPPWTRPSLPVGFAIEDQQRFSRWRSMRSTTAWRRSLKPAGMSPRPNVCRRTTAGTR